MDWGIVFWISLVGFIALASMVNTYNDRKKWEAFYKSGSEVKPEEDNTNDF
jgi:hypothetical protein